MSNINLLPWREAVKQRGKKQFFALLGVCALVTVLVSLGVNAMYGHAIQRQIERNQFPTTEMVRLDAQIGQINQLKAKRKALLERMRLIEGLQQQRNLSVRLFSALPKLVPNGVYLGSLTFDQAAVNVKGVTEAHSRVANMIRQVDASGWLGQTHISSIFATDSKGLSLSEFSLQFKVLSGDGQAASSQGAKP